MLGTTLPDGCGEIITGSVTTGSAGTTGGIVEGILCVFCKGSAPP